MLGSTAAVHPSQDCPVGMVDGGGASISGLPGQEPPPPPSRTEEDGSPLLPLPTGAGLSSPSTSARPPWLPPFLHSKNKGNLSAGEIAAPTGDSSTQVQDQHERPAKALPKKVVAAPTNGKSQDPIQDQQKRPAKTLPKKRVKTPPVLPVVRSPGVNLILSQGSPRTIGVKRSSPIPSQFSESLKNYPRQTGPKLTMQNMHDAKGVVKTEANTHVNN